MERHKNLYKGNKSFGAHSQENRERQNASRIKQRKEQFQDGRKLSTSPMAHKMEELNKENINVVESREMEGVHRESMKTELSQVDLPKRTTDKNLSRKEAFLLRFIQWKEVKKQEALKKTSKRPPFVPAGKVACKTFESNCNISFVPKNQGVFKPPVGLKQPAVIASAASEVMTADSNNSKSRKSFYTAVPTPTKKNPAATKKAAVPLSTLPILGEKVKKTSAVEPAGRSAPMTKLFSKPLPVGLPKIRPATVRKPLLKCATTLPVKDSTTKPASGAVGKLRLLQSKRAAETASTSANTKQKHAKLASNFKSKKPATKINCNRLRCALKSASTATSETPSYAQQENPFEAFVTSTRLKNSADTLRDICDTISPVEHEEQKTIVTAPVGGRRGSSTVKRALLPTAGKAQTKTVQPDGNVTRVYNFLQFDPDLVTPQKSRTSGFVGEQTEKAKNDQGGIEELEATLIGNETKLKPVTPTPASPKVNGERPINYLSPYVSVSRGKVSAKKEREKRNSVYVPHSPCITVCKAPSPPPVLDVEMLRTLESVRYFRKQLDYEIARLHALCERWESYRDEELSQLQDTNADDMINVTIGQTRLLTSKKFMQFKGLIDRCEAMALGGVGAIADNGKEDTKLITAIDLEGFWSMVGLQIDNVDKRFDNLQRWKDNAWSDPDAVVAANVPESKGKLHRVKKAKVPITKQAVKPSSALQQMLRKMHSEMRNNKTAAAATAANNEDIILTPKLQRRSDVQQDTPNSQTRRISVLVKDRKSYSAAPTIISVSSPVQRRVSLRHKSSQESVKISPFISKFNSDMVVASNILLRNVLGAEQQRNLTPSKTPIKHGRKSILKTPGTVKSARKSVFFNEQLRVKKFKFTIDGSDDEEECLMNRPSLDRGKISVKERSTTEEKEDLENRTYRLRTRRVVLRPSSEFVIPK